ncbi:MAG TPA: TIGR01777 family oxidoreductase [Euzebya sp.]|nr:TIGR01777 family oxidoreductase [Euzebya sp.]
MKIAITGSTGLIGQHIVTDLSDAGHKPVRMVRSNPTGDDILYRTAGPLDPAALRGIDAVVHLAGESIGGSSPLDLRWTVAKKQRILDSRVTGTTTIAEAMAKADGGPRVLISASAIGLYGDRHDEVLTEASAPGDDFMATVAQAWEASADPARTAGIRVVHPRFGIVLHPRGGALQKLLPLFRIGLGGRFGSGRQWWSWVSIADAVGAVRWALETDTAEGAYNITGPNPTTNAEFTKVLAGVLGRPSFATVPAFGPRLLLGELADALLFNSQRVLPDRLLDSGYGFTFTDLRSALRNALAE